MNKFLVKIFWFVLSVILVTTSVLLVNKIIIYKTNLFKLNHENNLLVLGDSHSRYALNDNIVPHLTNLSNNADSYFYSFIKLKVLKESNSQIDTLFLSFSDHNVLKSIENRWLLNEEHIKSRFSIYAPILGLNDFKLILNKNNVLSNFFSVYNFPVRIFNKGIRAYGGYEDLKVQKLGKEIEIFRNSAIKKTKIEYALIEIEYLQKIENFCELNHIHLILLNTPTHKVKHETSLDLETFRIQHIPSAEYWDFSKIEMPDSCFGDLVHLNEEGAKLFSYFFLQRVKE